MAPSRLVPWTLGCAPPQNWTTFEAVVATFWTLARELSDRPSLVKGSWLHRRITGAMPPSAEHGPPRPTGHKVLAVVLACLGAVYTTSGLYRLVADVPGSFPIDLRLRWVEERLVVEGRNPQLEGHPDPQLPPSHEVMRKAGGSYPPWSVRTWSGARPAVRMADDAVVLRRRVACESWRAFSVRVLTTSESQPAGRDHRWAAAVCEFPRGNLHELRAICGRYLGPAGGGDRAA